MKRLVFVINPRAGSGRANEVWEALANAHPELQGATVVREADPVVAQRRAEELICSARALIAVGGDGTVHLAANALLAAGRSREVALGIVPAGSGSDLARALGVPSDPAAALEQVLAGAPRPLDAIEAVVAGERHFVINVASAGVSGMAGAAVNALARRTAFSYLGAAVRALWRYRPARCRVWAGEALLHEGPLLLLAVANGPTFGKGMRVAPRALPDDGLADLVVVGDVPRWQIPFRLPQVVLGRHLRARFVTWRRVTEARFEPLEPFPPLDLDGDSLPAAEARFRVLPDALRVLL